MAVDYDAGRGGRGAYANLARALQMKLEADNTRRAEDIRRQGLFGTGITQDHLSGLAQTGLAIADFGDKRMQRQMQQAQNSFQRRQDDLFRVAEEHQKAGRFDSAKLAYEQADMERNRFEDTLSKYRSKGILGSRFGSDTVDYKRDPEAMENLLKRLAQDSAQDDIKEAAKPKTRNYAGSGQNPASMMSPPQQTNTQNYVGSGQNPASMMMPSPPQKQNYVGSGQNPASMMEDNTGAQTRQFTRYDDMLSPREAARLRRMSSGGFMDYRYFSPR